MFCPTSRPGKRKAAVAAAAAAANHQQQQQRNSANGGVGGGCHGPSGGANTVNGDSKNGTSAVDLHQQQNHTSMPPKMNTRTTNNHNSNNNSNNNENMHQNHPYNHQHPLTTSVPPYRYVSSDFHKLAPDEISVYAGDIVLYEYSDNSSGESWSHVFSYSTKNRGFVPSEILSTEPPKMNPQCKKKMPRYTNLEHPQHTTLHPALPTVSGEPSVRSNGANMRMPSHLHIREQQPRTSEPPHSLQGSSGHHSILKYNDFSPPAYHNLTRPPLTSEQHYEVECRQFHREYYGLFVVMNNYVAREENDLSVKLGEFVTVWNKEDCDWYWVRRECDSAEGFVPSRFICDYEHVKAVLTKGNSTVTMKSSNQNDLHTYINHKPERESLPTDQQSSVFLNS